MLENILPALLAGSGELVLHGSAVEIDGQAVLFIGPSGSGKSTLAVGMSRRGHRLFADDFVPLVNEAAVCATTRYANLWPDSVAALRVQTIERRASGKEVVEAGAPDGPDSGISRIFFLSPRDVTGPTEEEVPRDEAFSRLMESRYLLDPNNNEVVERHVERAARLAGAVPAARLVFPHRFDSLAGTIELVERSVARRCA